MNFTTDQNSRKANRPAVALAQDQKTRDAEQAVLNLYRASALVGLIGHFIDSGEHDMQRWNFHVGEALLLADQVLANAICTLDAGHIVIKSAKEMKA